MPTSSTPAAPTVLITFRAFPKTDIWQKVAVVVPLVPTLETVVTVDLLPYLSLPQVC